MSVSERLIKRGVDHWSVLRTLGRPTARMTGRGGAESMSTLGARWQPSQHQFSDFNVSPLYATRLRSEYIKTTIAKDSQNVRETSLVAVTGYFSFSVMQHVYTYIVGRWDLDIIYAFWNVKYIHHCAKFVTIYCRYVKIIIAIIGREWNISSSKCFISNGAAAEYYRRAP